MKRPEPAALLLLAIAAIAAVAGAAVVAAIDVGLGGKRAIVLGGAILERRATYTGLFALAGVALAAGLLVLLARPGGVRAALLAVLAMAAGALPMHFLAIGKARLGDQAPIDVNAAAYFERPATAYPDAARIRTLIDLPSAEAVEARRTALIELIWKRPTVPADQPAQVEADTPDPTGGRLKHLARTTRLTIPMEFGFAAVVDYFEPAAPTRAPVIYNHGHIGNHLADDALEVIEALLADGHPVAGVTMPTRPPNLTPERVPTPRSGEIPPALGHDSFAHYETPAFSPLKLFVHPLAVTINWLKDGADGPHAPTVHAVGFSGGGWTVTVAAAVDPRIVRSLPVAGTLPLHLMVAPPNSRLGDWEQLHPGLLARAGFLELYVLGGAGAGRRQVQILNQFDGCCFRGVGALDYAPPVAEAAANLGGAYDLLLTKGTRHEVNAEARARILAELR